ncbi:hypothetical protein PHMEG_00037730, partial [Phytophthora megakarya]
ALSQNGTNIDAMTNGGSTAFVFASMFGHLSIVHALVDHGASIEQSDMYGKTALTMAAKNKHVEVVSIRRMIRFLDQ